MAGKGLIADYYQTILGQVKKEKLHFFANDRILVNVTSIGHIGRMRSVFLRLSMRALRAAEHAELKSTYLIEMLTARITPSPMSICNW